MRERHGFTLVELLVVLALIGILIIAGCHIFRPVSRPSSQTVCMNNLGAIGRKYNDYAHESTTFANPFPRHIDDGDAHDTTAATGLKTADTLDAAIGACGMQTVWVMIDRGDLPDTAFRCPGDADWTSRDTIDMYGWADLTEFSYGIHYPYTSDGAATANPADPNAREATVARRPVYRENLILFADRNPGGAVDGVRVFHTNHTGSDGGCIVVSRVGNTKFYQYSTDSEAGFGDDIYTDSGIDNAGAAGRPIDTVPDNIIDTVITPRNSR